MCSITSTLFLFFLVALVNGLPFTADKQNSNQQGIESRDSSSCDSWYNGEGDPSVLLAQTLNPPCKVPAPFPPSLLDGWTVDPGCNASKQPNTCDLHKGAYGCYRHAFKSTGPGAQSCYDQSGHWIADPWAGAGTLDAQTPLGGLIQQALHGIVDVIPYYNCCQTSGAPQPATCNKYYEKRPPGQCEEKPAV
jgi:hypothetical protein